MDWIQSLLWDTSSVAHIVLLYSFVIAVGVFLGKQKIYGISLGVTFVLFMGILMGNMLGVNVLTLSTFYSGIEREQPTYYYLLASGATRFEAWLPFMREAVIKSFTPCIANMAVMGIVALPGTMIGQILGGSAPDVAVKYQMMIVIITMSAAMLSLILALWLSTRRAFDAYGRLGTVFR